MLRPRRYEKNSSNSLASDPSTATLENLPERDAVPYHPRDTRMLSIHACCGWRLKTYEVCFGRRSIPSDQVARTLTFVDNNVPWPPTSGSRHQAGFVIIHRGHDAMWLMVHVWKSDILTQFAYQAPLSNPIDFIPLRSDGQCSCVWELEVIKHERDAWVRCAMGSDDLAIETYWNDNLFLTTELK
jgi:hypothetical protein